MRRISENVVPLCYFLVSADIRSTNSSAENKYQSKFSEWNGALSLF